MAKNELIKALKEDVMHVYKQLSPEYRERFEDDVMVLPNDQQELEDMLETFSNFLPEVRK